MRQNFNLYQLYKLCVDGHIMHITCKIASSRIEAIRQYREDGVSFEKNKFSQYVVTGLLMDTGEDISRNFPVHVQNRIERKGRPVKCRRRRDFGYLYEYILKEERRAVTKNNNIIFEGCDINTEM